jgi:hypothetical protein
LLGHGPHRIVLVFPFKLVDQFVVVVIAGMTAEASGGSPK